MLSLHKQSKAVPPFSSQSLNDAALWSLSPNFLESTTSKTFLALDPTGFLTHNSSGAMKGSYVSRFGRTPLTRASMSYWTKVEPSRELCTDEIPWTDLHCYSPYHPQQQLRQRVSSRVPVINLPRIEGVN
ncbi:unnamed protein product [Peronospora destructor]|uniref:Uncharacterized protein n=1 Tax=Peronospora destructor TaxID=86335 RepID=A0AAV0UJH3_9STRA|nr:unnamed protein product [Peronospora destructor]